MKMSFHISKDEGADAGRRLPVCLSDNFHIHGIDQLLFQRAGL